MNSMQLKDKFTSKIYIGKTINTYTKKILDYLLFICLYPS